MSQFVVAAPFHLNGLPQQLVHLLAQVEGFAEHEKVVMDEVYCQVVYLLLSSLCSFERLYLIAKRRIMLQVMQFVHFPLVYVHLLAQTQLLLHTSVSDSKLTV